MGHEQTLNKTHRKQKETQADNDITKMKIKIHIQQRVNVK